MQNVLHVKEHHPYRRLLIALIVLVLVVGTYFIFTEAAQQEQRIESWSDKQRIRNNILSYVTVEKNNYKFSSIGGISDLVLTITNHTDYLLEHVRVEVSYITARGEIWRTKNIDFEMLKPNSTGTIDVSNTDRGKSVSCRITKVKSKALGL